MFGDAHCYQCLATRRGHHCHETFQQGYEVGAQCAGIGNWRGILGEVKTGLEHERLLVAPASIDRGLVHAGSLGHLGYGEGLEALLGQYREGSLKYRGADAGAAAALPAARLGLGGDLDLVSTWRRFASHPPLDAKKLALRTER